MRGIAEVEEPSVETLVDALDVSLFEAGDQVAGLFRGYTPREMPVTEVAEVIDTPENRYVKYFLKSARCWRSGSRPTLASRARSPPRARRQAGSCSCRSCSRTIPGAASGS